MRRTFCALAGFVLLSLATASVAQVAQTPSLPPGAPPPPRQMPGMAAPPRDNPQEKTGTAVLSGRVVATDTGKPLRRALVRASSQETPQGRSVSTNADGRWQLKNLPAGSYRVMVSKGGYVDISYGQLRPFETGKVLELSDGQTIEKLDVSLPRAGVITGRVLDEFGEPLTGARVQPSRYRYVGGQRRLTPLGSGDMTDDIGQFRLHGLSPGEYFVSVQMSAGLMFGQSDDKVGYATTYFPGTAVATEAQRVRVAIGQETSQINITMATSRVATISGTAVNSSGRAITRGMLMLASNFGGASMMSMGTSLKPDGSFLFSNVSPGEYRIQVQYTPNPDEVVVFSGGGAPGSEVGSVSVTVTGNDITGVTLATSPGATASGRIVFEGGTKPTFAPAALNAGTMPVEFGIMPLGGGVRVRDDWTFEATGLTERRRFRVSPPQGWYLKSVLHENNDITDTGIDFKEGQQVAGIDIVLTQRVTDVSGTVQDSRAKPITDFVVVAFSPDSLKWGYMTRYVRTVRPNQEGRFSIKGLPPDEYYVIALDYLEAGEEGDPEQLEKWKANATRVTLADGEPKSLTLKLNQ
jgi:Carboxypeptidase regulatory-like domain